MKKKNKPLFVIADWKEDNKYPSIEWMKDCCYMGVWAWEFLRRNPEYQHDFIKLEGLKKNKKLYMNEWRRLRDKYFVSNFIDPREEISLDNHIAFYNPFDGIEIYAYKENETNIKYPLQKHEDILIKFNLSEPIKEQIDSTYRILKYLQREFRNQKLIKVVSKKHHLDIFRDYLRILDAEAIGIDIDEIASVLLPTVENKYPDFLGRKRIKANSKAANQYMMHDYRYLGYYL